MIYSGSYSQMIQHANHLLRIYYIQYVWKFNFFFKFVQFANCAAGGNLFYTVDIILYIVDIILTWFRGLEE